ncbi:phosphotransferase family protein [Candidatus Poriferisodalis sp.]|uniref:phosphotransferase family protein n=1 Tax=Candidatus Poriferisodalis sp. TaxID=3101277 RepID=UPI003AF7F714
MSDDRQHALPEFAEALDAVLRREIDDCEGLVSAERLSGGASMESYRLRCRRASDPDGVLDICLRRGPDGMDREGDNVTGVEAEALCMSTARLAGVPEPEVLYVLTPADGIGAGFLMEWLDGVTLGARIARSPELEEARSKLAFQCGQEMARIHGIDVGATGLGDALRRAQPSEYLAETWDRYRELPTPQPMIDYAARWLSEQLEGQDPVELTLVHNDFRNGNVMVDADAGLVAVLDWETAHIGDPMRDLGWMCTNSWRFGQRHLPVGGFGRYEDLFAGYADVAGAPVDPKRVQYWEVFGSFWWAVGCLGMADRYRQGSDATVERPAIGRRSSECQLDCAHLIIPGQVEFVPAVHALGLLESDFGRRAAKVSALGGSTTSAEANAAAGDMPRVDEILESVRDFLHTEVRQATEGRTSFLALVAGNSIDIALRERLIGPQLHRYELERLVSLMGSPAEEVGGVVRASAGAGNDAAASAGADAEVAEQVTELRWRLVHRLRDGSMALDADGLAEYLRTSVAHQVAIDQPKYSAFRHLAAQASE